MSGNYGNVTGNEVEIIGNGVANSVYGGYIRRTNSSGTVNNNKVTISGTVNVVAYGGYTEGLGNVSGNTISVDSSGTVAGDIYGGYVDNTSSSATVSNNSVTISGTVNNDVFAGFTTSTTGTVINNTINIASTAVLTTSTSLWGSNLSGGVAGTGNTLNVTGFSGIIDTMGNFEYYNFVLGALNNQMFIETNGAPVDIGDSYITIDFNSAFRSNIINASNPTITVISSITAAAPASVTVASSPYVVYNYVATYDTGTLLLTVLSTSLNPQTTVVGEGFAAGLAFLGQAADVRSSLYFVPQGPRFIPFAKLVYGSQHITTGSSVTVKGFSALAGLALNSNFDNGSQLIVGAFVEGGWGN